MFDLNSPRMQELLCQLVRLLRDFVKEFRRELVGVLFVSLSLLTLISLLVASQAGPLALWSRTASRLFGLGVWPALVLLGAAGVLLILARFSQKDRLNWPQIVGWELALFSSLGLLHLLASGDNPAQAAEAGRGGGYIGWGIVSAFQPLLGATGTLLLLIPFTALGAILILRVSADELKLALNYLREKSLMMWERMQPDREPWDEGPAVLDADEGFSTHLSPHDGRVSSDAGNPSETVHSIIKRTVKRTLPRTRPGSSASSAPEGQRDTTLPPLELLRADSQRARETGDAELKAEIIVDTLAGFGIPCRIVDINRGPSVTQFGIEPGFLRRKDKDGREVLRKIRVSKIHALSNDLALALSASPIRIEAPVPGRPYVGIEVPNDQTSLVSLRGVMESEEFRRIPSPLTFALGRDVSGAAVAADLATMPHLLIAGATGSGKSVCINALVTCLLCQNRPERVRMLMIDPKRVELTSYNGVPHLIAPVVVEIPQVVGALNWVVREMDRRYQRFAEAGARHLTDYNRRAERHNEETLPYLVVVVDELADLMMAAPMEIEQSICRIAQMARATGIHLVIATQRPSVDVVTGLIKANFPARIAFAVTSQVDSRVILDTAGAEKLLGRGDMLLMTPDSSKLARLQGCFVSDKEIRAIVRFWQKTYTYEYNETDQAADEEQTSNAGPPSEYPWEADEAGEDAGDALLGDAIEIMKGKRSISTSYLQRALRIGYPRAARLMDLLEEAGYVGPNQGGGKPREVFLSEEE